MERTIQRMTNEELQQIQAIVQAAVAPIVTRLETLEQGQQQFTTRLDNLEQGQKTLATKQEIQALHTEMQASEKRIIKRLDGLEHLSAHYQDLEIRKLSKRVTVIEKQLQITPE
jgi:hypothetical protein